MKIIDRIRKIIHFRSLSKEISYEEAIKIIREHNESILIDVRSCQEFTEGHLPGAISIPVYDLARNIGNVAKKRDNIIILYCQTGGRSKKAAKILADLCYTSVFTIKGGLEG